MRRQRPLLIIFDPDTREEITFVERSIGSSGRDILAIKLALGVLSYSSDISNRSPQDVSIGKSWFDCETGKEVTSTSGIRFDEKTKNKLMNFQIQNQFTILSYYFEKYGIRSVATKEDLLAQILQSERIFETEFGNIGEGTLHVMHGWVPDADMLPTGYVMPAEVHQQVPMYIAQALLGGSMVTPDRIKEFYYPFPDSTEPPWYEKTKRDFKKFYQSSRDIASKINEVVGYATWKKVTENSQLFVASKQVFQAIADQPKKTTDTMSRKEIDALATRAFEPDPKTDPDPWIINYNKIGAFIRTEFDLDNLPTTFSAEQVSSLKATAAQKVLVKFSKSLDTEAQSQIDDKIAFVDMRTPSLRPGDVYRAYFEIDKQWIESLPRTSQRGMTEQQIIDVTSQLTIALDSKLEDSQKILEDLYCADGGAFDNKDAKIQYQKYRAFATKNKKEIVRSLRDAAQKSLANQQQVGNNFTFDLGVFGKAGKISDTELINSVFNFAASTVDHAALSTETGNPSVITYTLDELQTDIDRATKNLREAAPDVDNYRFADNLAFNSNTVLQAADNLSRVPQSILDLLKANEKVKKAAEDAKKTVRQLFSPGLLVSMADSASRKFSESSLAPSIKISFEDSGGASKIVKIDAVIKNSGEAGEYIHEPILREGKLPLENITTAHYLRNIESMARPSGALCNRLGGSQAGMGARFVIKYTRPKQNAETNPWSDVVHFFKEPAEGATAKFIKEKLKNNPETKKNAKKKGRPNVTAHDIIEATRIVPANFELNQLLPLIGDDCTFGELAGFLQDNLEKLMCNYIECMRLPGFNVKVPDIDLDFPDWPGIPTFEGFWGGFDFDKILDNLIDILSRLLCRFARKMIEVLTTPFCGDELVEDLFGASSAQVSPAVRKALGDSIIDLGVPKEESGRLGDFIEELSRFLTPRELCRLFDEGVGTLEIDQVVDRLLAKHGLSAHLQTLDQKHKMFTGIGVFLDPKLCEQLQNYNNILGRYDCKNTSDLLSRIRNRIARNEEVQDSEIQEALDLAQQNMMDTSAAMDAMINGEGLASVIGRDMLNPSNPDGLINLTPDFVMDAAQDTADLIFEAPRMSYVSALKNFVPSMYLTVPTNAGPGDPNYNPQALMIIQRHTANLKKYAEKNMEESSMEGDLTIVEQVRATMEKVKTLYYDYIKETLQGEEITDTEEQEQDPDNARYRTSLVYDQEADTELEELTPRRNDDGTLYIVEEEMFPIRFSSIAMTVPRPVPGSESNETRREILRPSLKVKDFEDWAVFDGILESVDDEIVGDYLEDLNQIMRNRLDQMRVEIEQNIEKAFAITEKSKFLSILREFYNVELEQTKDATESELIDYRNEQNALVLFEPPGMRYESNIIMKDLKSNNKRIPYYVNIKDDLFLGKQRQFNYCQEIPEEFDVYGSFSEDDFPRKTLFSKIYFDKLLRKVEDYRLEEEPQLDLTAFALDQNAPNSIDRDLYDIVYAKTAEGTVEQITSFLSNSRLFNSDEYVARLTRVLRGNSYFDSTKGCIKNKFNLVGLSEIGFDKAIVYDFGLELKKEYRSDEYDPLQADASKPKPMEKAIANVVVRAFFRICILEVLLKGAISFSVWDLEYLLKDQFFRDYLFEYITVEIERNQSFTEYKKEFEEALIRTSGRKNKYLALRSVMDEELVKFPKFSKILYDHDSTVEHTNWFSNVIPMTDAPEHMDRTHPIPFEEIPIQQNCFAHFERYLRLDGPLANPNSIVSARYDQAASSAGLILSKLRGTNFDRQDMPQVSDYIVSEESPELAVFNDAAPNSEFLSPKEFDFLIQEILYGDDALSKYFADLLNVVGPEQTARRDLQGLPQAIDRTPIRTIRRKRKFLSITDFDPFTSNSGTYFEDLFSNYHNNATEYQSIVSNGLSEDEDRFYLVPLDAYEYWSTRASESHDYESLDDFMESAPSSARRFFEEKFLFESEKTLNFPEAEKVSTSERDMDRLLEKVNATAESGPSEGRGITISGPDPLSPTAPWAENQPGADRRQEDVVFTIEGQEGSQGATNNFLFQNNYGEVSESTWQKHLDDIEGATEEVWQETVIDMTLNAAPVFDMVGESYDVMFPFTSAQNAMADVLDYIENNEENLILANSEHKPGSGTTLFFQNGNTEPSLADGLGYKKPFNYREETLFNKPSINKSSNGTWTIGSEKPLKRNDYKFPVRILITQILDSTGNVTSTFAKCEVPSILDINDPTSDPKRYVAMNQALQKICRDFTNSIEEAYNNIANTDGVSDAWREAIARPRLERENKYYFVKEKVPDFPVFCRTANNTLPNDNRDNFLSVSKLYSVAAGLEASGNTGNFSLDRNELDKQFSSRGSLIKSGDSSLPIRQGLRTRIREEMSSTMDAHYNAQTRTLRDQRENLISNYSRIMSTTAATRAVDAMISTKEAEATAAKNQFIDSVADHIDRQIFLAGNNLYAAGGLHSILDSPGDDGSHGATFVSLSNIITWFSQRRSEGLWGKTYNIRDTERNQRDFDTYQVDTFDSGVQQLPVEAPFFMAGNSMFHGDGRTYDWQLLETLFESFDILSDSKTSYAKIESYKYFQKALLQLRDYSQYVYRYFKFAYGDNYKDSQEYKDHFITFANELAPNPSDFHVYLEDCYEAHENKGRIRMDLGELGRQTEAQAVELAEGEILPSSYYRNSYTSRSQSFKSAVIAGATISGLLSENDFLKKLRKEVTYSDDLGLPNDPIIKELFGNRNRKIISQVKKEVYQGEAAAYVEMQYNILRSMRYSYKNMRERYLAALGPQGLGVLEDMLNILAAYRENDIDGNPKILNAIKGTIIKQGLRLVHTIPKESVPQHIFQKFSKTAMSIGSLPWTHEERIGLMNRVSPGSTNSSNVFCSVMAEEERTIESLECWGLGSTFLETFYDFDTFMLNKMTENMDYKAYSEICFPVRQYSSLLTVHSTALLGGYNTMPIVLSSTKESLTDIIQLVANGTGTAADTFGVNFSNTELKNMLDEGLSSKGLDPCFSAPGLGKWARIVSEMVEEMIKRFPAIVLRGIAEQIDPAYREIKRHWLACDMDNFANKGPFGGQVMTFATGKKNTPLGVRNPKSPGASYAPVNLAFPVDLGLSIYKLIWRGDSDYMYRTISKLVGFIGKGSAPFLDPSYAFQIPCKDVDFSGDDAFNWDKFKFGGYGRYGHPATLFTFLAFMTSVLPGDVRQKQEYCIINEDQVNYQSCEDEEE